LSCKCRITFAVFIRFDCSAPLPEACEFTCVTTPAFLGLWGLTSLRDLPDLDRLEEAGLLGKAPLPEELRGALGTRFTQAEMAAFRIVSDEVRHHGVCALHIDAIAARAGTCRTTDGAEVEADEDGEGDEDAAVGLFEE
jgi:hypothetical protein